MCVETLLARFCSRQGGRTAGLGKNRTHANGSFSGIGWNFPDHRVGGLYHDQAICESFPEGRYQVRRHFNHGLDISLTTQMRVTNRRMRGAIDHLHLGSRMFNSNGIVRITSCGIFSQIVESIPIVVSIGAKNGCIFKFRCAPESPVPLFAG